MVVVPLLWPLVVDTWELVEVVGRLLVDEVDLVGWPLVEELEELAVVEAELLVDEELVLVELTVVTEEEEVVVTTVPF